VETVYHVLWELVHVFFEHKGLLADSGGTKHDAGASSFLYPFLDGRESDAERVLEDVRRSAILKAEEVTTLRHRSIEQSGDVLTRAACAPIGVRSWRRIARLRQWGVRPPTAFTTVARCR
jgi:D-sedoheptulose 7-phosphate isomerase